MISGRRQERHRVSKLGAILPTTVRRGRCPVRPEVVDEAVEAGKPQNLRTGDVREESAGQRGRRGLA